MKTVLESICRTVPAAVLMLAPWGAAAASAAPSNKNVLWKSPLSGQGHASPIVWGDRVFVPTALWPENVTEREKVIPEHPVACYQVTDGRRLWDTLVPPGPWLRNLLRNRKPSGCCAETGEEADSGDVNEESYDTTLVCRHARDCNRSMPLAGETSGGGLAAVAGTAPGRDFGGDRSAWGMAKRGAAVGVAG
jgi:hypothetical protein